MTIRRFDRRGWMTRGVAAVLSALLLGSGDAAIFAQDAAASRGAAPAEEAAPKLSNDQIESLVAPIALYPDPLLSQALVASTYPLEIVQAGQWLAKNTDLKGEALTAAAEKQSWDPSVQAMVETPELIKRLSEDITWTTNLGNAFLDQQDDVMDAVQRLRGKARDSGKLESTEQQKVETKVVENKTVVVIQPTSAQVVYVPTYSPAVIWGPPVYPYPPIYYPPYSPGAAWLGFGVGMAVGIGMSGGWGWGCGWGHGGNNIYINNNNNFVRNNNVRVGNTNINSGNSNWNHNSNHRGGAPYSNKNTANKYGGSARGGTTSQARTNASASSRQGSSNRSGASSQGANRSGGGNKSASAGSMSSKSGGGGDRVGNRSVPTSSSSKGGAFSGASSGASSANHARASSSRGASSMGRSGGGGGKRR